MRQYGRYIGKRKIYGAVQVDMVKSVKQSSGRSTTVLHTSADAFEAGIKHVFILSR